MVVSQHGEGVERLLPLVPPPLRLRELEKENMSLKDAVRVLAGKEVYIPADCMPHSVIGIQITVQGN